MIWRYIASQLLRTLLVVFFSIALLEFLISLMGELTYSDLPAKDAIFLTVITAPTRLINFAPVIFLVSLLVALGGLANRSELVVMLTSGVTKMKLIGFSASLLVLINIGALLLTDMAAPSIQRQANLINMGEAHRAGTFAGTFIANNRLTSAQVEGETLSNVRQYLIEDGEIIRIGLADTASYSTEQSAWQGEGVANLGISKQGLSPREGSDIELNLTPDLVRLLFGQATQMTFFELAEFKLLMAQNEISNRKIDVAFWDKIAQPVMTFSLLLLSASFVFGSTRKVSASERIIQGIVVGVAVVLAQDLLVAVNSAFILPVIPMSLAPAALIGLYASWRLSKS